MQSSEDTYLDIMLQSLKKKKQVLDAIGEQNKLQKQILEDRSSTADAFDQTVEAKSALIDQLDQLDSGFDKLFTRVQEELETNREEHRDKIAALQDLIRTITELSMDLQKQEAVNKSLMTNRFALVKKQAKSIRANAKVTSQYYQTMMKTAFVDPQFMDKSK